MNSEDPEPDRPMDEDGSPDWCVCNVCVDMANEEENKCCTKRSCVTLYKMFRNVVLDREVLCIAFRARCDIEQKLLSQGCIQAMHPLEIWKVGQR